MDRTRRILSRGWLSRTLSVLTFGYFPVHDEPDAISDWCISDAVRHLWSQVDATIHGWTVVDATRYDWSTTDATRYDWTSVDAIRHTWTLSDVTRDC